jgi:hypothetical protein
MPFTASISEEASPFKLALPAAYTVITNIQAMNTVNEDGTAAEPVWQIFTAVYANEAAFKSGCAWGASPSYKIPLDTAVMPLFEAALKAILVEQPGVTNVIQTEA